MRFEKTYIFMVNVSFEEKSIILSGRQRNEKQNTEYKYVKMICAQVQYVSQLPVTVSSVFM